MRMHPFAVVLTVILAPFAGDPALAAPQDFQLSFASLPSAQGFAYAAVGSHAGAVETSIFSVAGGVLTQNSMGQGFGVSGGSIFYQLAGVATASETKQLRVTARCTQVEGSGGGAAGQGGFTFGFNTGSVQYDISITPTQVYALAPSGQVLVPGSFDNTQFHEYVLDYAPPGTTRIYRDGVLLSTSTSGFSFSGARIFFGDGTGGANAFAQIRAWRFVQNLATPTHARTWGALKRRHR